MHPARGEFSHGLVDVLDREVEDRVGGWGVVGPGIDEGVPVTGQMPGQQPVLLGGPDAECLALELAGGRQVTDGKPAEGLAVREHDWSLPVAG
jgi:hypothetical protein